MARPRRPENEAGTCLLFAGVVCVAAVDNEEAISQEGERMPRKVAHFNLVPRPLSAFQNGGNATIVEMIITQTPHLRPTIFLWLILFLKNHYILA